MAFLKRLALLGLIAILSIANAFAATSFVVRKIRVEGLHRITLGTVLSYLPIKQGDTLTPSETSAIITSLYNTGFFSNVNLSRQGNELVVQLVERPTIGNIKISGNKKIPTKKLQEVLKNIGIEEGNVFDRSILEGLQESLQQQYVSLGNYNAKVTTRVTQESRNRVGIDINIYEGGPAKIKEIKIIGNHAFSQRTLLRQFEMTTFRPWSFFTHSDQYSRDKLDADLETLRSYYMDRGYIRFKVNSSNATLSPDNKSVTIVINITEGNVYHLSGYNLTGNLLGEKAALQKWIPLKKGEVFSRKKIVNIDTAITHYYGDRGYASASVNPVPVIDDANHQVFINFKVNSGPRVYVRRVTFSGNTKTQDIVLRREMRQEEGGLYSISNIEESKRRLANLGYLQNVQTKTQPVPGSPDQVDVNYDVTEKSSATASVQAGYSDMYGLLYGANVTENNLLGSGKQVSLAFENSEYSDMYSFSYNNPYYTESGISRGFSIFSQHVTPGNVGITPYTSNIIGGAISYGLPISEYSGLSFGYGYQNISINPGAAPSIQIQNFINKHGTSFNQVNFTGSWSRSTYDRAILPTRGTKQILSGDVGVPVFNKSLEYYNFNYQAAWYQPLPKQFILYMEGDVGYGNGYGPFDNQYPFFKNYTAGGMGSVRGYESNTLGPQDSLGNPIGGNVITTGTMSLIVPNPISDKLRLSAFIDAGNVYQNSLRLNKVRFSTGIGAEIYIPMVGPLELSVGIPLNPGKTDQTDMLGFSVGTSF